jgi:hypothetical protein
MAQLFESVTQRRKDKQGDILAEKMTDKKNPE